MTPSLIPVSEIATAAFCPVCVYYQREFPWKESPEYAIVKQVSYHLGKECAADEIWEQVAAIHPGIPLSYQHFLSGCLEHCSRQSWRRASEHDLFVKSERFGICGTIDRVFQEPPYFSIVRSGKAPVSGFTAGDRLRVLGYSLCLSELLGREVPGGLVEYIPQGISRYYEIQPRDMRKFFSIRTAIRKIDAGSIPKKSLNAPCGTCGHKERCDPGPRRLSERM